MIKPYYQDNSCTIYNGDCFEIMEQISGVNSIITDPPYILTESKPGGNNCKMSLKKFESDGYVQLIKGFDIETFFELARNICKPFNMFCFCSNSQISELMHIGGRWGFIPTLTVWHKTNAAPFANGVWKSDLEFCIHIKESGAVFKGGVDVKSKVFSGPCVVDKTHPTVKPLELIKKLVVLSALENQLILDPFMGSGTTLRAAKDLNRKAIGIEINEKYCEVAAIKLAQEAMFL